MVERTAEGNRFKWRLPLYGVLGALIAFSPMTFFSNDICIFLYILVVAPFIGLVLLVIAICNMRRQRLAALSMLAVYCVVSWVIFKNSATMHTNARWFLWSKTYKAEVLAQPSSADGELRHIEWDGWGFPGAGDTVVYLVSDPNDSLSTAAKRHLSGKFNGIPCAVPRVHRLENRWYTVLFYTDTVWGQCD